MTTTDLIAKLTKDLERERALWSAAVDLTSHHGRECNRLEIDLAEATGDTERAAYLRLMNDPSASDEAKHAAYIRVQAKNALGHLHVLDVLPARDRDEVRAEVERLQAERDAEADADLMADHPSHEVAPVELDESPGPSTSEDHNHNPGAIHQ